ncbi:hypothetical protein [Frankia sp. Cj5]|uniref:hypothetical protein n=1 Tax=Frankia sp. Cj5 TaxID=2880978 RepID=UPI001EF45655|nr:hypothetical protein [Frankia sp. Cj5]
MIVGSARDVPEAHISSVDHGFRSAACGTVEGVEHRVGAIAVTLANQLARQVQYRLEGEFGG